MSVPVFAMATRRVRDVLSMSFSYSVAEARLAADELQMQRSASDCRVCRCFGLHVSSNRWKSTRFGEALSAKTDDHLGRVFFPRLSCFLPIIDEAHCELSQTTYTRHSHSHLNPHPRQHLHPHLRQIGRHFINYRTPSG